MDNKGTGKTSFTREEDDFLREHFMDIPVKRMARMLGRSGYGTRYRMEVLGLIVPPEVIAQRKRDSLKGGRGWNKGKKQADYMSAEAIDRTTKTRFQTGHLPHNTREDYDLSIRKDSYVWVRMEKGKWELLHRFIYRIHHNCKLVTSDNDQLK